MGDFTKLQVWSKAKDVSVLVYKITSNLSFVRDKSLQNQICRSAVSVPSNIAEGAGYDSNPQSIRFFNIARGSLAELRTQLIPKEIGSLSPKSFDYLKNELIIITAMLTKIIKVRSVSISKLIEPITNNRKPL
ncbi:MAG: four helix bundle protein [Bacteroidales bacterium]|jgi:four helix bundle protein|nr:four helix bundle protein [Bacteroidales bacterium]